MMYFNSLQFLNVSNLKKKTLISFKFANKDSIIRKASMHYVNTTFKVLRNSLLEKGKYLVTELSYFSVEN